MESYLHIMNCLLYFVCGAIILKAWFFGSDFNFILWFKYSDEYLKWYENRPEFKPKENTTEE